MSRRLPFLPLLAALIAFAGSALAAHASEAIAAPAGGRSATVTQPHVTAELISAETSLPIGRPFQVALHLHMDPGWHTYWINPGDAGLATSIKWTLPPGIVSAGPIEWPTPESHPMGPLTTYGYGGDVYLLTTLQTIPALAGFLPPHLELKAHATWLVCQEECIPGKADLAVTLDFKPGAVSPADPARSAFFAAARTRLPVANTRWEVAAARQHVGLADALVIRLREKRPATPVGHLEFVSEQGNVLAPKNQTNVPPPEDGASEFDLAQSLQQNGEFPPQLSGVLVSDRPLIGQANAVRLGPFATNAAIPALPSASLRNPTPAAGAGRENAASEPQPLLLVVLGAAFLGGLILNLMPCVLPVLSLKVFSLIKHAGENSGAAWRQGLAFTAGVVVSFWVLAGLLLVLRAAGNHLGWGFQMQSPGFVLALTFLFFLLALNLFGVFELGASLVGLDAKASSHLGGLTSSFANGALATLAATPCTAPFMGSSVGFAAQQPPAVSLLIFTFLALGMAAPYLALTTFPGALRLVPRPGPWMEALRQFMGFLLMATVIFLVYVFGALAGPERVPMLLGALLLAGVAAWIFGRWSSPVHAAGVRTASGLAALVVLGAAIFWGAGLMKEGPSGLPWQTYSPEAVQKALAAQRPVFVDFTAAWCLSCKVNEQVALEIDSTRRLFEQKHVVPLRGDWTHSDPEISRTLQQYHRDGVPLYLLYSPKNPTAPQVLPEVLTPGIVAAALQKL